MIYVVPNETGQSNIWGFKPDVPYISLNSEKDLPPRLEDKSGYIVQLYSNLATKEIWWRYDELPPMPEPDPPTPPDPPTDLEERVKDVEGALDILLEGLT